MKNALAKFLRKSGLMTYTIRYYSAGVEAAWTIDDEGIPDDPSMQIVYERNLHVNGEREEEKFWLYLSPEDAAAIGAVLTAWAQAHGERL